MRLTMGVVVAAETTARRAERVKMVLVNCMLFDYVFEWRFGGRLVAEDLERESGGYLYGCG